MVRENISDVQGSFFEVPAKHKGQKSIFFGRIESEPVIREDSESEVEPPIFSHYEPNVLRMMENMGYDLMKKSGLNFSKGRRTLLRSFVPKGKGPDYYHKSRRGLGYILTQIPSTESEESYHDHSSGTSSWESDVGVGGIFKELSVNMVSTSHAEEEVMIQSNTYPWIKHLNSLGYSL